MSLNHVHLHTFTISRFRCFRATYHALAVWQPHASSPDLEAVAQLVELHFLDLDAQTRLQLLHHLMRKTTPPPTTDQLVCVCVCQA